MQPQDAIPKIFPQDGPCLGGENERCCGKTDPQDGLASWGRPFAPPRQSSLGVGRRSPPRLPAFRERATRGKKARWYALGAAHIAHAQGPAATERPIDLHSPVVRPVVRQHADHHREAGHSCGGRSSSHLGDHYTQDIGWSKVIQKTNPNPYGNFSATSAHIQKHCLHMPLYPNQPPALPRPG